MITSQGLYRPWPVVPPVWRRAWVVIHVKPNEMSNEMSILNQECDDAVEDPYLVDVTPEEGGHVPKALRVVSKVCFKASKSSFAPGSFCAPGISG